MVKKAEVTVVAPEGPLGVLQLTAKSLATGVLEDRVFYY